MFPFIIFHVLYFLIYSVFDILIFIPYSFFLPSYSSSTHYYYHYNYSIFN